MVAERLLAGKVSDHYDVVGKLIDANFHNSRMIAEVSAGELASKAGISIELARVIHDLAVEEESGGKVDTAGGAYIGGGVNTGGRAFVGGRVRTGSGKYIEGDDR